MVHDQIRHDVAPGSEGADVVPRSDAGVDGRVVDRVEPGVSAVDRDEEGQDVDAAEHPAQLAVEQAAKPGEVPGQAVGVGDQLCSGGPVHTADAMAKVPAATDRPATAIIAVRVKGLAWPRSTRNMP